MALTQAELDEANAPALTAEELSEANGTPAAINRQVTSITAPVAAKVLTKAAAPAGKDILARFLEANPNATEDYQLGLAKGGTLGTLDEVVGGIGAADYLRRGVGDYISSSPQASQYGVAPPAKAAPPVDPNGRNVAQYDEDAPPTPSVLDKPFDSVGDAYRTNRDAYRAIQAKVQKRSPYLFGTGEVLGGLLVPVPGAAAKNASFGTKLGRSVLTGAELGAANAVGNSEADLTKGEVAQFAGDVTQSAGVGAATGGLLTLGGGAAKKLVEAYGPDAPIRALKAAGAIQKDLDKIHITEQRRLGQKLLDEGVIPFGASKSTVLDLSTKKLNEAGKEIGYVVNEANEAATKTIPAAREALVEGFSSPADKLKAALALKHQSGFTPKQTLIDGLKARISELEGDEAQTGVVNVLKRKLKFVEGDEVPYRLSPKQVHDFKVSAQSKANYKGTPSSRENDVEEGRKFIAGLWTDAEDAAVGDVYAQASSANRLKEFKAAKKMYGDMATASELARQGVNREAGNNTLGLTGVGLTGAGALLGAAGGAVSQHGVSIGIGGVGLGLLTAVGNRIRETRGDAAAAAFANWAKTASAPEIQLMARKIMAQQQSKEPSALGKYFGGE